MIRILLSTVFFLASITTVMASPVGTWRTGKAQVKVTKCKSGICAKVISLRNPTGSNGKPVTDQNNPKAHLRRRPVIGISLFLGMRKAGQGAWQGRVYSPEKGGIYKGSVSQISGNLLKVTGCLPMGFPCQSVMWKRAK